MFEFATSAKLKLQEAGNCGVRGPPLTPQQPVS